MIRKETLKSILKKAGLTDAQIADFVAKLDEDMPDEEAAALLASLMSEDEAVGSDKVFAKIKGKAKDEALTPFTALLATYEPKLTPEQKTEYGKLGADAHKKYQFILNAFDSANTKTGDANYDELKSEFDNLKLKLSSDYVPKTDYEGVQSKLSAKDRELIDIRLVSSAGRSKRLKDITGDRHFQTNFVRDAMDLLETGIGPNKQKGTYNAETGRVMRTDSPDQPVLIDGKPVTLDVLADLTITAHDSWQRKADNPPINPVSVPTSQSGGTRLTPAQLREIEQG